MLGTLVIVPVVQIDSRILPAKPANTADRGAALLIGIVATICIAVTASLVRAPGAFGLGRGGSDSATGYESQGKYASV